MKQPIIIAIDGFSSCGKSTLAKEVAKKLGFVYVDSGAMYRAVALYFSRNAIDLNNNTAIENALKNISIKLEHINGVDIVLLNGEDVSHEIRNMQVSNMVSSVATLRPVRKALVLQQQALGKEQNIVMDGRDIGTVVFPQAKLKLFMTADPKVRAERRYKELIEKGENVSLEEILENVINRDQLDLTRSESPLVQAPDATILDNTYLTREEQLDIVIKKLNV